MPPKSAFFIILTLATAAVVSMAAIEDPVLHMAASALACAVFIVNAAYAHTALTAVGALPSRVGSSTAQSACLVWTWGALAILATYTAVMPNRWPEWWHFFLGFAFAAAASLAFSRLLGRDADAARVDPALMKAGRALIVLQLIGVVAGIISMFADGKFPRSVAHPDWAACNIFFFGAVSIAAISIHALRSAAKT